MLETKKLILNNQDYEVEFSVLEELIPNSRIRKFKIGDMITYNDTEGIILNISTDNSLLISFSSSCGIDFIMSIKSHKVELLDDKF